MKKLAKILLIALFAAVSWARLSADEPTYDVFSYGWFSASGVYPIEYWVDAYDNDGDLQSLRVSAHDEGYDEWYDQWGTGNGSHLQAHGWGATLDGYSDARIWITDSVDTYYHDAELVY